jgi:hypothetical protein
LLTQKVIHARRVSGSDGISALLRAYAPFRVDCSIIKKKPKSILVMPARKCGGAAKRDINDNPSQKADDCSQSPWLGSQLLIAE